MLKKAKKYITQSMKTLGMVLASLAVSFSMPVLVSAETISQDFSQASNLGLYGGEVRDIAVDAVNGYIAVTTYSPNGVFVSHDAGVSWQGLPSDLDLGEPRGVEMDEVGNMFILMSDGLFTSTDHGVTWAELGEEEIGAYAGTMVYSNGTLFVGRTDGQANVSVDGGATFTTTPIASDMFITSVDISADGSTVYAILQDNSRTSTVLYKSMDTGSTWSEVDTSAVVTSPALLGIIAVDPVDPLHLIMTSSQADNHPWRSTDGGDTWTELDVTPFATAITFDSSGREYLGVDYSDDGGANWSTINPTTPSSRVSGIVVPDPSNDDILYAGSFAAIAISTDRGATWTDLNNGITAVRVHQMSQSTDKNTVWAATNAGLAKTTNFTDDAPTWEFPLYYESYPQSVWVNPETPDTVVVGGMGDVYVTTDGGSTWTTATGWDSSLTANMFVHAPGDLNTLYATASYHNYTVTQTGDVFKSIDGGLSWTSLDFPENGATQAEAIASDGTLYVGTGEYDLYAADAVTGIYKYDGSTWTHLENSPADEITSVLVDPSDDTVLYATAANFNTQGNSTTAGVYRSIDSGETWEMLTSGLTDTYRFTALAAQPTTPTTVYVAGTDRLTGAGVVYKSADGGDNWYSYYTGLENEAIHYLLFDGLVAGNSRGAYSILSKARLQLKAADRTVPTGTRATVTVRLKDYVTGNPIRKQHVRIFRKKQGEWVFFKKVKTNKNGVARLDVKIKRKTQLRARWNPSLIAAEEFLGTNSATLTLRPE